MPTLQQYVLSPEEQTGTFDNDEKLPNLPVPTLEHTIQRYLESVKPFAESEDEYRRAEKLAYEFMNGEGAVLHQRLLKHAARQKNWIETWWEDYAYLTLREPLIPHYSMSGPHPRLPGYQYGPGQQIKMASMHCHQLVQMWQLLRQERFRPAVTADKRFLSMNQYRRLFNCSVVPGVIKDTIKAHFKTEREGVCSSKVVVLCKGRMFVVDGLRSDGQPLTPADWEYQLTLVRQTPASSPAVHLPCLSCDYRTPWARNKEYLVNLDPVNANNFTTVDLAMFVVCLDDDTPATESEVPNLLLCGDYSCRWPDAALNVVFFSNGLSGGLCGHSPFDGIVSGSAMHFAYSALKEGPGKNLNNTVSKLLNDPQELNFVFDSYIESEIDRVKTDQVKERNKIMICQKEVSILGKRKIQNLKVHPDSFIQMALQLSYYILHSRFAPCYETATTRIFYNGRTETVRSCTEECALWVKSMVDPQTKDSTRATLLLKAIQRHNHLMSEARNGQGCDRHLLGLYLIATENNLPVPQFYEDPLYKRSGGGGNFILSTSLLGYSPIGGGVSPMCLNGYGIFYNILSERLVFTISVRKDSYETSSFKLFQTISHSLHEMARLLENHTPAKL